jgi:hypothetical protein
MGVKPAMKMNVKTTENRTCIGRNFEIVNQLASSFAEYKKKDLPDH